MISSNRLAVCLGIVFLVGFSQEVARKLVPGLPWIQLAFVPFALLCSISLIQTGTRPIPWSGITLQLKVAGLSLLIAFICSASGYLFGNDSHVWSRWMVGLIAPSLFVMGIFLGSSVPWTCLKREMRFGFTTVLATLMIFTISVFAESFFQEYPKNGLLGPLPPYRPWIRTIGDTGFRMLCGLFRSPDIAGWWLAVEAACFMLLAYRTQDAKWRWIALVLAVLSFTACVLCGRRKMQLLWIILMSIVAVGFAIRKEWTRLLWSFATTTVVFGSACACSELVMKVSLYSDYTLSAPIHGGGRLVKETLQPIRAMLNDITWFGEGLGTMAPGVQHVGLGTYRYSEGGFVRVLVESGIVGLILVTFAIGIYLACLIRSVFREARFDDWSVGVWLGGFAIANLFTFSIGQQVYGDPFISLTCGLVIGYSIEWMSCRTDNPSSLSGHQTSHGLSKTAEQIP